MVPDDPVREAATTLPPSTRRPAWARVLVGVAILALLGFIGGRVRSLRDEWRALRDDQSRARAGVVVGYRGINPDPNLGARPVNWMHDEGDRTLLWAGYRNNQHHWFRVGRGEIDFPNLSLPIGRDTIRAVNHPIFERGGGTCWDRVPEEAPVVGLEGGDVPTAYPIRVMDKVLVVNDRIGDRPSLVIYSPIDGASSCFRSDREGRAIVMGLSGYFVGYSPLLFDRETESLWLQEGEAVTAVAGSLKGTSLARFARVLPVAWADWRARHPRTRLLIGADRTQAHAAGPAPLGP